MSNEENAIELIREAHRLWENELFDDALTLMESATELAPQLPDPWIDIAALHRAKNPTNDNELLEKKALDADRKFIELGENEEDFVADITLAKKRVAHREAWETHIEEAYKEVEKRMIEQRKDYEKKKSAENERKNKFVKEAPTRNKNQIKKLENEIKDAEKTLKDINKKALDANYKLYSRKELREAKKSHPHILSSIGPENPYYSIQQSILLSIESIKSSIQKLKTDPGPTGDLLVDYSELTQTTLSKLLELRTSFNKARHSGEVCPHCYVRLDEMPPKI